MCISGCCNCEAVCTIYINRWHGFCFCSWKRWHGNYIPFLVIPKRIFNTLGCECVCVCIICLAWQNLQHPCRSVPHAQHQLITIYTLVHSHSHTHLTHKHIFIFALIQSFIHIHSHSTLIWRCMYGRSTSALPVSDMHLHIYRRISLMAAS